MFAHVIPSLSSSVDSTASENSVVQASTMNAEQVMKDSGRGPASKVAPLLSGSWSMSAKKSRTFDILAGDCTDLCCGLVWILNTSFPFIHCLVQLSMVRGYLGGDCPRYGWLRGEVGTRFSEVSWRFLDSRQNLCC